MTQYLLREVFVASHRSGFVLFGSNRGLGGMRFHSRLQQYPGHFPTASSAAAYAIEQAGTGRLYLSQSVQNGHHAGAVRCGFGCEDRFRMRLHWPDINEPRVLVADGAWSPVAAARGRMTARSDAASRAAANAEACGVVVPQVGPTPPERDMPAGIASAGVELECEVPRAPGWTAAMASICDRSNGRMERHRDGSVHALRPGNESAEFTFWSTSMAELGAWLDGMYASGAVTNPSCGFHVHVRPEDRYRWAFATRGYWDGFKAAYQAMARAHPRRGIYVARETCNWSSFREWSLQEAADLAAGSSLRYAAVNLQSLTRHRFGTIEHRILPDQETAEEARSSLGWLVSTASRLATGALDYGEFRHDPPSSGLSALFGPEPDDARQRPTAFDVNRASRPMEVLSHVWDGSGGEAVQDSSVVAVPRPWRPRAARVVAPAAPAATASTYTVVDGELRLATEELLADYLALRGA